MTNVGCKIDLNKDPYTALDIMASYCIPVTFESDLKSNTETKILETDDLGRIMFSYKFKNFITNKWEFAIIICQKFDDDYVYYYDDICYFIGSYSVGDLEILKATNDWNSPYDDDKMARKGIEYTVDLCIVTNTNRNYDYSERLRTFAALELDVKPLDILAMEFVDEDSNGQALYWVKVSKQDEEKNYFVISNRFELTAKEIFLSKDYYQDIADLKKSCDWNNGN